MGVEGEAAGQFRWLLKQLEQHHEAALAAVAEENEKLRKRLESSELEKMQLRAAAVAMRHGRKRMMVEPTHLAGPDVESTSLVTAVPEVATPRVSSLPEADTNRLSSLDNNVTGTLSSYDNNDLDSPVSPSLQRRCTRRHLKHITADSSFGGLNVASCWVHSGSELRNLAPSGMAFEELVDELRNWRYSPNPVDVVCSRGLDRPPRTAPWMIGPMSDIQLFWTLLGGIVILFDAWETPLILVDDTLGSYVLSWAAASYWTADVLLTFRTGVYQDGLLIWDATKIASSYAQSWLLFDIIVVVADWVLLILRSSQGGSAARILKVAKFTKILRFARVTRMFNILAEYFPSSALLRMGQALVGFLGLLWALHLIACFAVHFGDMGDGWELEPSLTWTTYLQGLLWSLSRLQGNVYIQPLTAQACFLNVAAIVVLLLLYSMFLSYVITLMHVSRSAIRKSWSAQLLFLHEFKQRYRLTAGSIVNVKAVLLAVDSAVWSAQEREAQLLETLPNDLKRDLCIQKWGRSVAQHSLFGFMHTYFDGLFQDLLLTAIKDVYSWPQEVVFAAGQTATGMFFVARGQLTYQVLTTTNPSFSLKYDAPSRVGINQWLSEPALWTKWHHRGKLVAVSSSILFLLDAAKFQQAMSLHPTAQWLATLYACAFVRGLDAQLLSDRCDPLALETLVECALEECDGAVEDVSGVVDEIPWERSLPSHITPEVCRTCINLARDIAARGLDENRPHHGFIVIVGSAEALQPCGRSGFNPFQGHDVRVIDATGEANLEALDILRRSAFHGDGAVVVDGKSGRVVAAGWFVGDISQGGTRGGARSRSARAVAKQAGCCYVIKASEDSRGELNLHLGERATTFSAKLSAQPR